MRIAYLFLAAGPFLLAACGCGSDDPSVNPAGGTTTTTVAAGQNCPPPRTPDDWHACDTLFAVMGGVQGKTVADLFVGDGYYTMKLLEAGARVIAMDDDPNNIAALEAKKKEMGICDERLVIRSATPGSPNLTPEEVDLALCTRPYVTLTDPTGYFTKVKAAVKFPNSLFLVEFLPEQTPVGPPMDQRIPEERLMNEMELCGFTDIGSYSKKLPYRYLMHALTFVEGPGDEEALMNGQEPR